MKGQLGCTELPPIETTTLVMSLTVQEGLAVCSTKSGAWSGSTRMGDSTGSAASTAKSGVSTDILGPRGDHGNDQAFRSSVS
jgi:hypothetical protein